MIAVYGQDVVDELRAMAREVKQWDREELVLKRFGYRARVKRAETTIKNGVEGEGCPTDC